jgi:high-affinity iron transporter
MRRAAFPALALLLCGGLTHSAQAGPKADPEAGKATYAAQCLICHGEKGDGDGPAGAALQPRPTDFTAAAWWEGRTDQALMAAIRQGSPGTSMQGFNKMSREELESLMAYLRGFEGK